MKHLNIEIKAKCSDHEKIRALLVARGADCKGIDHQVDTYFKVGQGRLKLREGSIENFLIYYKRENQAGPKQSDIQLFATEPGSALKAILVNACGILTVVDKKREIYFIDNVKFHIDIVEQLGTFIEIEAIDSNNTLTKEKLLEQCQEYMRLFEIKEDDLLSVSYSDLLLGRI